MGNSYECCLVDCWGLVEWFYLDSDVDWRCFKDDLDSCGDIVYICFLWEYSDGGYVKSNWLVLFW